MLALDFMLDGGGNFGVGLSERQVHAVGCHTEILTHPDSLILSHQFPRNIFILPFHHTRNAKEVDEHPEAEPADRSQ